MFLIQDSWMPIEPNPAAELDPEAPEPEEDPHAASAEGAAMPRAAHCSIERRLRRAALRSSVTRGLLGAGGEGGRTARGRNARRRVFPVRVDPGAGYEICVPAIQRSVSARGWPAGERPWPIQLDVRRSTRYPDADGPPTAGPPPPRGPQSVETPVSSARIRCR